MKLLFVFIFCLYFPFHTKAQQSASQKNPAGTSHYHTLGTDSLQSGDITTAIQHFETAIQQKEPAHLDARMSIVVILYAGIGIEKNIEESVKHLKILINENYKDSKKRLADIYYDKGGGDLQKAKKLYLEYLNQQSKENKKESESIYLNLAKIEYQNENYKQSLHYLEKIDYKSSGSLFYLVSPSKKGNDISDYFHIKGKIFNYLGQEDKALEALSHSKNPEARLLLAQIIEQDLKENQQKDNEKQKKIKKMLTAYYLASLYIEEAKIKYHTYFILENHHYFDTFLRKTEAFYIRSNSKTHWWDIKDINKLKKKADAFSKAIVNDLFKKTSKEEQLKLRKLNIEKLAAEPMLFENLPFRPLATAQHVGDASVSDFFQELTNAYTYLSNLPKNDQTKEISKAIKNTHELFFQHLEDKENSCKQVF